MNNTSDRIAMLRLQLYIDPCRTVYTGKKHQLKCSVCQTKKYYITVVA